MIGKWHTVDPAADEQGQEVTSPYCYVLNNPVRNTDPDGRIALIDNLIGAAVGAVVEYGGQVAANMIENGASWSAFTDNIDLGDIAISAGEGFIPSGGSTLAKVATTVVSEVGRNALDVKTSSDGSGKITATTNNVSTTVKNTAIGLTLGKVGEAAPAAMKATLRNAPTANQAVKIARTEAKESGKIVNRETRNNIVREAKAAQNTASSGASEYTKRKTDQQ